MENVITLGKLIGLLFLLVSPPPPPPLYFVFDNFKNARNELACPGTIFLVYMFFGQYIYRSMYLVIYLHDVCHCIVYTTSYMTIL